MSVNLIHSVCHCIMPLFAVVYSNRSRHLVNFIHSFLHKVTSFFVVQSCVCYVEHLGSDSNKISSDSDSDSTSSSS